MKRSNIKIQENRNVNNLWFTRRQGYVCFFVKALAAAFLLSSVSPLAFGEPLRVGSSGYPDISTALKAAAGRTVLIETPIILRSDLEIPSGVHLLFQDKGRLVRAKDVKSVKVTIKGSVTAPMVTIFEGFELKEVIISARRVKEVYPQWWGAKGDGRYDDTKALQSAIYASSSIFMPKGQYRITKPLDLTDRLDGLKLAGQSMIEDNGSVISGQTGGVVLDLTGSAYVLLQDFEINNKIGRTNRSTVGIFMARCDKRTSSSSHTLERVRVDLRSDIKANNGIGTIGIYCWAAEDWRGYAVHSAADNGIVFTSTNIYKIQSTFIEHNNTSSMGNVFMSGSVFHGYRGAAIVFKDACEIELAGTYIGADSQNIITPTSSYAIKVLGSMNFGISWTGRVESWYRFLHVKGPMYNCRFWGSMLRMDGEESSPVIYVDGSDEAEVLENEGPTPVGLTNCIVNLRWLKRGRRPHVFIKTDGKNVGGIRSSLIYTYGTATIDVQKGYFLGNSVYTTQEKPKILNNSQPGMTSYVLYSPKGIEMYGPVKINDLQANDIK